MESIIYGANTYRNGYVWSWWLPMELSHRELLPMDMTTFGADEIPMELLNMELLPICGADYLQRRLPMELLYMELLPMGLLLGNLTAYWAIVYTYWLNTYRSDYPVEPTIYLGATCATEWLCYWLSMELITWGPFSMVTHDSGLYGSLAHFPSTACSPGIRKTSSILDLLMD